MTLQETDAAVSFLSSGMEQFVRTLSEDDSGDFSNDHLFRSSQLKSMASSMKENFQEKFGEISGSLPKLFFSLCNLFEDCTGRKDSTYRLQLELEKASSSTESAANVLQKMEGKYTSMKSQVREAKSVMEQQQSRYQELLNAISALHAEKEKKDNIIDRERDENRRIIYEQNEIIALNETIRQAEAEKYEKLELERSLKMTEAISRMNESVSSAADTMKTTEKNGHERSGRNEKNEKNALEGSLVTPDEEDVKILHETLVFVETLALHATELETRYEELLVEKRLLKKICRGYGIRSYFH